MRTSKRLERSRDALHNKRERPKPLPLKTRLDIQSVKDGNAFATSIDPQPLVLS